MTVRVLIVDDHTILRSGLRALLIEQADLDIIGEAANGEEAVRKSTELCPDIILLDISLPGMNGLETAKKILTLLHDAKILFLTMHDDVNLLQEALDIGARGYILKRAVESELINAIYAAARGDLYIDPAMTTGLLQKPPKPPPSLVITEAITPRETEVLNLIAQGYTNRQVSEMLCISIRTVESHRASIMDKLNLQSRVELIRYARDHGMLD